LRRINSDVHSMKVIAWLSLVLLVGSFLCRPIADPDLWWHITVGRWIVSHREVPEVDYWNMFGVGQPWRAYSWSNEIVYALVDARYGHTGLAVLQLLLGISLALTMQWVFGVLAGNHFFGALLGVVTTVACRSHFSLRPQTFVWILFVLVLLVAELSKRSGTKRSHLIALVCLGSMWANTHLSAIFGVIGVVLWSIHRAIDRPETIRIATMVGAFVTGTLCTPYLGGEWLTFFEKSDHVFSFRALDEFKPADLTQVPTACLLFQILCITVLSFASNRLPPRGGVVLAACAVFAGALAVKFTPFASIAVGALTAVWLRDVITSERGKEDGNKLLQGIMLARDRMSSFQPQTLGACAFFVGCIAWVNMAKTVKHPVDYGTTPRRAVDFLEAHSLQHPVLHEFSAGGYLEYRWSSPEGNPHHLVAIDGRTNVNRRDIWESYTKAFRGREGWRDYFSKIGPRTVIWRKGSPLVPLLLEAPEWCRVFESGTQLTSYAVFISREEFDRRRGEFEASDCT
jgi:hypothetical protein